MVLHCGAVLYMQIPKAVSSRMIRSHGVVPCVIEAVDYIIVCLVPLLFCNKRTKLGIEMGLYPLQRGFFFSQGVGSAVVRQL